MKYLVQIYPDRAREAFERMSAHEQHAIREEYAAIGQSPEVIGGEQLQPAETATTVRIQNGETLLTDGPFVDAKEHLGGYCLVEADDLDARSRSPRGSPLREWAVRSRCDPWSRGSAAEHCAALPSRAGADRIRGGPSGSRAASPRPLHPVTHPEFSG